MPDILRYIHSGCWWYERHMPDNLRYIHGGCWWYERRMPDNLHYIHDGWLVMRSLHACPTICTTYMVVVGSMSIAWPTIYTTYTVVGWWYERHMPDNLHYIHGVWLVVRPITNTEATVSWTSSRGVELMA